MAFVRNSSRRSNGRAVGRQPSRHGSVRGSKELRVVVGGVPGDAMAVRTEKRNGVIGNTNSAGGVGGGSSGWWSKASLGTRWQCEQKKGTASSATPTVRGEREEVRTVPLSYRDAIAEARRESGAWRQPSGNGSVRGSRELRVVVGGVPGDASECEQTKRRHDPSPIQLRYSRLDSL